MSNMSSARLREQEEESISIHPQVLTSLAKHLKESETKIEQLESALKQQHPSINQAPIQPFTPQDLSSSSLRLSVRKEAKLKSLLSELNQLVYENDTKEVTISENDIATEAFHRYPAGVVSSREISTGVRMDLNEKFSFAEEEQQHPAGTTTSQKPSTEMIFDSGRKRKFGFAESTQYMSESSSRWQETIESFEKKAKTTSSAENETSTPTLFSKR
jgi:hypothetical protein